MRLLAFRVENYRSVLDSGWVDLGDISVIVGKNESGKTSLLKALWKFNPFIDVAYDLDREWPRGRRRERDPEKPAVTLRFAITPEECTQLNAIDLAFAEITGVEVQRNYRGEYNYQFLPQNPEHPQSFKRAFSQLKERIGQSPYQSIETMKAGYRATIDTIFHQRSEPDETAYRIGAERTNTPSQALEDTVARLTAKSPVRQVVELVHSWLPTFIYMDDYKIFTGTAQLDQMKQRKNAKRLTEEDRTVLHIMEMAGLALDDEVKKIGLQDKEQRMLDMNDASQTLTEEIAHRWSQKKYEVMFQADGAHFITFVKDADTSILVPLEERSKGFQWFFSFDMMLMRETKGEFRNAIILLDEPGLHLHASAQRDLLARMRAYASDNQLLYTTHLPFMVDLAQLDYVYVAEDIGHEGTQVHHDWRAAGQDARFTLQAAMGLAWSQGLTSEPETIIVPNVVDYWILTAMADLLRDAGESIPATISITPAGGAIQIACVGALLHGTTAATVLLDATVPLPEDLTTFSIPEAATTRLINLQHAITHPTPVTVEDLFPRDWYLELVQRAYQQELGPLRLSCNADDPRPIIQQTEEALTACGIAFQRTRVARLLLQALGTNSHFSLPSATVTRFAELFRVLSSNSHTIYVPDAALPGRTTHK